MIIVGSILVIAGCLLMFRNHDVAVFFGEDTHYHFERITSSVARLNIAVIGALMVVAGVATFFVL